ncbi:HSPB1-associated protein 1 homolog isoform X2 [Watersipora subatra]
MEYAETPGTADNPLREFIWAYADYKYMKEIFHSVPELLADVDWSTFGFTDRDGRASTFWMGSKGAYTPCHYDTYGCNLVAQLYGKKKWTLFPPSETDKLYPTRIPFEESTVFSQVDLHCYDPEKHPLFPQAKRYDVVLEAGQVLFVPKHWWHFVECETTAISVNTWIELDSDKHDRINELLAAMLTKAMTDYAGNTNPRNFYNPKEDPMAYDEGVSLLNKLPCSTEICKPVTLKFGNIFSLPCKCCRGTSSQLHPTHAVQKESKEQRPRVTGREERSVDMDVNKLLRCVTHPRVINAIAQLLQQP